MNADALPDEMPVRSLCPRMVYTACGLIGADVRPDGLVASYEPAAVVIGPCRRIFTYALSDAMRWRAMPRPTAHTHPPRSSINGGHHKAKL